MAFTWSALPTKGSNTITAVFDPKLQELQDNVDHLCDQISISRPVWESFDDQGDPLKIYGVQDEIDRVEDENYCRTDCLANWSGEHIGEDSGDYISAIVTAFNVAVLADDYLACHGLYAWNYESERTMDNPSYNTSLCSGNFVGACGDY